MGKNTFLSIGKPLSNRNNIIVSTTLEESNKYDVCRTVKQALKKAKKYNKDIYIIGGEEIFRQTLTKADEVLLSIIKQDYPGSKYFPGLHKKQWKMIRKEDLGEFEFVRYRKKETPKIKQKFFSKKFIFNKSWLHKHPLLIEDTDLDNFPFWL